MTHPTIAVVDYKAGNLTSVIKALDSLGAPAFLTEDPDAVRRADKIMLPGVGHFAATRFLDEHGLTAAIREKVEAGAPFLGICVGLQWLFAGSTEAPGAPAFAAFPGICERFSGPAFEPAPTPESGREVGRGADLNPALKCPHVGWNSLQLPRQTPLTAGIEHGAYVYYTHSYRAPVVHDTTAITDYGGPFTAIAERDNIMGVQFHPEKSAAAGLRLLQNFVRL